MEGGSGKDDFSAQETPKRSLWDKLLRRGAKSSATHEVSSIDTSEQLTAETPKTPEQLKEELMRDLGRLADMQQRILRANEQLGNLHNVYSVYERETREKGETPLSQQDFKAKLEGEKKVEDKEALAADLVDRMEKARDQLGDYAVVVNRGGQRGVILLSPQEYERRQSVYVENPDRSFALEPQAEDIIYEKTERGQEIFFVTPKGLGKFVLPSERENTPNTNSKWVNNHGVESSVKVNVDVFERYKNEASSALYAVINNKDKTGHSQNADVMIDRIERTITGQPFIFGNDRQNDRFVKMGTDILQQHIPAVEVTKSEDVRKVFEDSATQAQLKSEVIRTQVQPTYRTIGTHLYLGETRF